jgi:hypothetical protein
LSAWSLKVAEDQPIVAHEQRIVVPAGAPQGVEHFRPDRLVMLFALGDVVGGIAPLMLSAL